jgi:DnaJ-class molecular chaperone
MAKDTFKFHEINEEHEIELYHRRFDCPECDGGGEVYRDLADTTGEQFWEQCDECDGDGSIYLRDSRPCKHCNEKIYFNQIGEKWVPISADTDEQHRCKSFRLEG